ncbi:MAG: NAD(P)H-dependent oxidoreductase [Acidimicrobiia bacterium]|nr:NAD(P)H-dependent oxidoreductase [Acidimicrobiia bacterium]
MNVLLVFCHPVPGSFGAAVRDKVQSILDADRLRAIDLYDGNELPRSFSDEDARDLAWARAVILIYPTWWGTLPAPLMGWIEEGLERSAWENLERVVAVTTHGSSRFVNRFTGGTGRRIVMRGLPRQMTFGASGRFIALYSMDQIDDTRRAKFLDSLPSELDRALR